MPRSGYCPHRPQPSLLSSDLESTITGHHTPGPGGGGGRLDRGGPAARRGDDRGGPRPPGEAVGNTRLNGDVTRAARGSHKGVTSWCLPFDRGLTERGRFLD